MSTVPHNATETAHGQGAAAVLQATSRGVVLDAVVKHFVATADALSAPRPGSDELVNMVAQVAALTGNLFPGRLTIEPRVDPEARDDVCLLFQVDASGSVEQILAIDKQWHLGVVSIAPQWPGLFCLSIDAR